MRLAALVVLAGCRQVLGLADLPPDGAARDGAVPNEAALGDGSPIVDAPADGPTALTCLQKWQQHVVTLGAAVPVAQVNSSGYERDPFVTADGLALYFSHVTTTPLLFVAQRSDTTMPFGAPISAGIAGSGESKLSVTADGAIAFLAMTGANNNSDVFQLSRTGATTFANAAAVMPAATASSEFDPIVSADGLRLYWAVQQPMFHIALASRGSTGAAFTFTRTLDELGTGTSDPAVSFDETVMLFSLEANGGDLEYATRASLADPFTVVGAVPGINTTADDADAHLTRDACHLYFASNRTGNYDIYVADVL